MRDAKEKSAFLFRMLSTFIILCKELTGFFISSWETFEKHFGKRSAKKKKDKTQVRALSFFIRGEMVDYFTNIL